MEKNMPASAGDTGDKGSTPGLRENRLSSFYHEQGLPLQRFSGFLPIYLKQFIYEFGLSPKTQPVGEAEYKSRIHDTCLYLLKT